jgi:predicted ATP-grasp superfamily ATP-dependent carboligase
MPTLLPRSSQAEGSSLLLAAISARALAQSARRAGFTPLVADFFADTDTQEAAHACRKLKGGIERGLRGESLLRALEALAELAPSPLLGFVYGAGFEDRTELLALIAKSWPLLGNHAATVKRLKAPEVFFAELDRLSIPHPLTASERPAKGAGWLAKKRGGAGGSHIVPSRLMKAAPDAYYQERVEGRAVSALFIGNGSGARVLGFSEQWTAPAPKRLWRYGGAVRPAALSPASARRMASAVMRIAQSFKIKGLASADFMVTDGDALLLEINPRPGATLDIFDCGATPLMRLHVEAVTEGKLPTSGLKFEGAMASAIVYADKGGAAPSGFVWPEWSADRPKSSERIDKNRPICTVWARGSTKARAKRLIKERICKILAGFQSVSRGEDGEQKGRNRRSAPNDVAERQRQGGATRQSSHR